MATVNPPAFHCIVCTLTKIPFASLSKESQHKIVRNGRPTPKMPNLTARCLHDWMTGCDREKKLYCWPCLLFNTSEYDVWGKRGFSDFHRLSSATIEHTKDVSHQAKSKTLKLWIETAEELSDSSGAEEDVECIPELDFLNAAASEMDEELDVKPNVEALNAALGLSQDFARPVVDLCETAEDGGSVTGFHFMSAAIEVDCQEDEEQNSAPARPQPPPPPEVQGENSQTSNASSSNHIEPATAPGDGLARIYKNTTSCEEPSAMMSQTATQNGTDKYQLKWQGHHQNVNVSLSSLYKNDRYADVMLLTCNGDENYVIPAHKLILGTSSLYFANIFDKNAIPMNAISYIVLPPDLTYRSMQILIQYMYTGESTVSTDILSEVLRGGEILKIRGLWRNDGSKPSSNAEGRETQAPGSSESVARRFASPVSVTLPSHNTSAIQPAATGGVPAAPVGHINIKRDMAIDPGDRHRTGNTEGPRRSQRNQGHMHQASGDDPCPEQHQSSSQMMADEQQISFPIHEHQRRLRGGAQERMETASPTRMTLRNAVSGSNEENSASAMPGAPGAAIPEELNFLNVKAEPVEWTDVRAGELALPSSGQKGADIQTPPVQAVKAEAPEPGIEHSRPSSATSSTDHPTYSPLTCELCSETFTIPGEWVRHIESHGDSSHTIPKRKRRLEGSDETIETAALRCDLCATFYVTPADWVRHVQSAHTETELAISNKRQTYPRRTSTSSLAAASSLTPGETTGQQDKVCKVCNKSFPSHASMLVHKRTHTGEKPFYCDTCNKGFSVKSNLLRHLRTLHNVQGELPASPQTDHDGSE
ncbi:zinc finger and BTB domain-containing protein 18-like isoform X1 [Anopheles darlingi]|uniref:zinc finger and BTB domain-containing protein 18-like isoform X1 n=1 Tax=Anopheles darlingi TaxID=43151 RepID=UPI0021000EB1|nr:zinc finger and BTB domain-containing protein 18-like isoform X1 [Anopheles darlingi]